MLGILLLTVVLGSAFVLSLCLTPSLWERLLYSQLCCPKSQNTNLLIDQSKIWSESWHSLKVSVHLKKKKKETPDKCSCFQKLLCLNCCILISLKFLNNKMHVDVATWKYFGLMQKVIFKSFEAICLQFQRKKRVISGMRWVYGLVVSYYIFTWDQWDSVKCMTMLYV